MSFNIYRQVAQLKLYAYMYRYHIMAGMFVYFTGPAYFDISRMFNEQINPYSDEYYLMYRKGLLKNL